MNVPRMITLKIGRGVPCTSKWRKSVNISHFETPYNICFRSCEILRVKTVNVSMKTSWIFFPFIDLNYNSTGMFILTKNHQKVIEGTYNLGHTIGIRIIIELFEKYQSITGSS